MSHATCLRWICVGLVAGPASTGGATSAPPNPPTGFEYTDTPLIANGCSEALGASALANPPSDESVAGVVPGSVWNDEEADGHCHGTWTRLGNTSTFSSVWADCGVSAQMQIQLLGRQIIVSRTQSSDGNDCTYTGQLSADGSSVAGSYSCAITQPNYPGWSALIHP